MLSVARWMLSDAVPASVEGMDVPADVDDGWRRIPPGPRSRRIDLLVAVLMLVGALLSVWLYSRVGLFTHSAPVWQCVVWAVVITLPLALRRRYPIVVAVVIGAAFVAGQELHVPEMLFSNITFFLAFYSIGAWSGRRTLAMAARIAIIAVIFVWLFSSLILGGGGTGLSTAGALSPYLAYGLISILTNLLYFGAAYVFGEQAFRSARQRAALQARTAELDTERERTATQAVALERMRIARELHDVVAHHVSVMGVQAGAARRVLPTDPEQAGVALGAIEESARSAVDELHVMLRTLRDDSRVDAPDRSSSTRGLDQLQALADEAESAGLQVRMSTIGNPRSVPSTVGMTAYRVAQEALTNTRKHAGHGASVELRLRYLADALELEIGDDGHGTRGNQSNARAGLGHVGMRERVAAVGGSIELGPKARGGYLVRARFPLGADAAEVTA